MTEKARQDKVSKTWFPEELYMCNCATSENYLQKAKIGILYFLLLLTWPVVFLVQLIEGIRFLFSPRKRLMGLGILAMQVFLIIGITLRWIPSPI